MPDPRLREDDGSKGNDETGYICVSPNKKPRSRPRFLLAVTSVRKRMLAAFFPFRLE